MMCRLGRFRPLDETHFLAASIVPQMKDGSGIILSTRAVKFWPSARRRRVGHSVRKRAQ